MRILFVAETSSIHTARWINQLEKTGWDIHVFQGTAPGYGVCKELKCGELHLPHPPGILAKISERLTGNDASDAFGRSKMAQMRHARSLPRLIKNLNPHVIHSLGLNVNWNNLCQPVVRARQVLGEKGFAAPWVYSSWGTDLDYYAFESAEQRTEVETVLKSCDYYIAECRRDARLAEQMGFRGQFAGFFPAFGGVPWDEFTQLRQQGASSSRKTVFLKGRDNSDVGGIYRAMTAMKAFRLCGEVLSDYQICIALASPAVAAEADALSSQMNLRVRVLPRVPYVEVLRIMGASRLFLSLTANDGLPSMLVEAMSLGSFPIHSDLESIREWVKNGEAGLLVPYDNPAALADAIKRALTDDELVDRAAELNARLVQERLSDDVVRPRVIEMYEHVAKQGPTRAMMIRARPFAQRRWNRRESKSCSPSEEILT